MKQVWVLNHYAQEPDGAGGTRHYHLADHLRNLGWQATVIAASVDHGTGKQRLLPHEIKRLEFFNDVPFLWIKTPEYDGNGGGRIRNMLQYTWRVLLQKTTADLPRPDVVIGSSVHPFAAVAGAYLARRFKVPFVFEVRDLWPQTLIDMGRLKSSSLTAWILRKLELWLYRRAVRIIVLLPRAWEYITPLGIPKERVIWVPNGVDLSLFPRATASVSDSEHFTLMYFGAHGQANGLDNVLSAMKFVQEQPNGRHIRLRMIGDGPLKQILIAKAREIGLINVSFEPSVPKSPIPEVAAQADAFVFNLIDVPVFRYGISSNKLFDFMASARPVIFSCDSANNPISDAGAGLTVGAGQPEVLADAILKIAATPLEERRRMGRAGRVYVEQNYSFEQLSARLAAVLDDVCAEHALNK